MAVRLSDFLYRHRVALFGLWLVHVFLLHYYVLGYLSWDGFAYRVAPMIELLRHGSMNKQKFEDWALHGYTPFLELIHIPFLYLFRLRGLLIGFPLVVFPLCAAAIFAMLRELTGNKRLALFGAFAYVAIPMNNQQPFTGYVDFAVTGTLAFWVYAMARLRAEEPRWRTYVRLVISTVLLTMARQQGLYIVILLSPILAYAMFVTRARLRFQIASKPVLWRAAGWLFVGSVPAIVLQIYKIAVYGSPLAPLEMRVLGIQLCPGVPMADMLRYAGIGGMDFASLAKGFFEGFVWYSHWPLSAFYASRFMAAGLLGILGILLLPVFIKHASRLERFLIVGCVLVSLLSRDYAVPRWSYTLMLSLVMILARSIAVLAESPRGRWMFWIAIALLFVHLLRPEFDVLQYREREVISPRMNISGSTHFLEGDYVLEPYPDQRYKIVVIEAVPFYMTLYGRRLRNVMLGTVRGAEIDAGCKRLAGYPADTLFIDDQHFSKNCNRECVLPRPNSYCAGWHITPTP